METSETSIGAGLVAPAEAGTPTVSIVIPAFNEAGRIAETIRKIEAFVRRAPFLTEIIVVDDGSRDDTSEIVAQLQTKGLRLIRNKENHGKGHTVRQGVRSASGKYVLFTDADLSAPIEELNKLLDVATSEGADIVIGFFFSSRRRHTRFSRDWSSDVCSSDLVGAFELEIEVEPRRDRFGEARRPHQRGVPFSQRHDRCRRGHRQVGPILLDDSTPGDRKSVV